MDEIKPVAWRFINAAIFRKNIPSGEDSRLWNALYDQQAIDMLMAEVDRLREESQFRLEACADVVSRLCEAEGKTKAMRGNAGKEH